jgi:uroporphyrin-III C-methyltransferase/precorrin-2 dehydrogenase/sirohydrochlorin ferrochelatase
MAALAAAGIDFEVVPGVTAAFAAAAEHRIPLTLRDSASALVFATGHDADGETLPGWAGLALTGATVAVYMGRAVAASVAARLLEAGLASSTPVAVIESASRRDGRVFAGRLDELARIAAGTDPEAPVLIIIGDVVAAGAVVGKPASLAEIAA